MKAHHYVAETLDDLMVEAFQAVMSDGIAVSPTKGATYELLGVSLVLQDPRARLSRTEGRGKPFGCLGELCWYLSGSNAVEPIAYYLPYYERSADSGVVYGGYGPRLLSMRGIDQLANVIALLRENPASRRAAVQLFAAEDLNYDRAQLPKGYKDIPCTCTLQFLVRDDRVNMITYMRSNDVWKGLPHDVFCFTMLQEIVARSLHVDVGAYYHMVGSFHLYSDDRLKATRVLGEGWQSTRYAMPVMPEGDPWKDIGRLLTIEADLRTAHIESDSFDDMPPYWADLARLLAAFAIFKRRSETAIATSRIQAIRESMTSSVFDIYLEQLQERTK